MQSQFKKNDSLTPLTLQFISSLYNKTNQQ